MIDGVISGGLGGVCVSVLEYVCECEEEEDGGDDDDDVCDGDGDDDDECSSCCNTSCEDGSVCK